LQKITSATLVLQYQPMNFIDKTTTN